MHDRRRLAAFVLLSNLIIPIAGARGQYPQRVRAVPAPAAPELPEQVFAEPKPAEAKPDAKAVANARLQKIQQLTFDRRASSILRAWSEHADKTTSAKSAATEKKADDEAKPDPFDAALKTFQHDVTVGNWGAVKTFLATLPEDEAKAAYKHLVDVLPNPPGFGFGGRNMQQFAMNPQMAMLQEKNTFTNADVLALAAAAPRGLDDELIAGLGQVLSTTLERGEAVEDFITRLRAELAKPEKERPLSQRQGAKLLIDAGQAAEAGSFLPGPETAEAENDREALNLLSRHYLAVYAKEKKSPLLEKAWKVTQAVLAVGTVDREQKDEALMRAVDLAPKVRDELGRAWLEQSFTDRPERGIEIIAAIGGSVAKGFQTNPMNPDFRKKSLELQKTAVEALLRSAPEKSREWRDELSLLAGAWLTEAEFSHLHDQSTSRGPRMRRDVYGNFFYMNDGGFQPGMNPNQANLPQPVPIADIIENMPASPWVALIDDGLKPKFAALYSQLYLKVHEEDLAFPYIEQLAATHPEKARELAEEFLRVWTRTHDPNSERNRTNSYMFMYGFERKAESIPLTRSKQERNLLELAAWIERLRKLPIGGLDEKLLAQAFTTSHSAAEVYRIESIEKVFGVLGALKPETLAELVEQMRGNLVGVWRQPAVQEQNKTKRKEKDIRAEVLRGYELAKTVVERGLQGHPDHWALVLAGAAIMHDENNYLQEIEPSLKFAPIRTRAIEEFGRAARLYAARVPALSEDEESTQAFEMWFYASLGASDLAQVDEKKTPDLRQPPLIREAIRSLSGEAAERHMSMFANALFTRMSSVSPAVKFRYLRGGFEIVGDHKQAREARQVYDYYKDLVTEIKLDAAVDGGGDVGHGKPFGLFVNLRHTREIERESGGFGRYLQNQNQGNVFFYNYGRPLENYRDKFQDAVKKAVEEHFEVVSVTFEDEKVNSKATQEYGWRVTPYAYVLLKARSPEVDKIPPLRLDLDFLDTSGYVILPVETPAVPIDAGAAKPSTRPFAKLQVTQTLDERQAKDGKLVLEVKAVALGLVPDLDQILDPGSEGFAVVKSEDQGLSVSRFDPDSDETKVISERSWLITMQAVPGQPRPPETFTFAAPKVEAADVIYQRYADADLAKVDKEIRLEAQYGHPSRAGLWWAMGGTLSALTICLVVWRFRPRRASQVTDRFPMPEPVTPFTVLGLLRDIQQHDGLTSARKVDLTASIERLETHYFAEATSEEPDLHEIARSWIRQAR